MEVFMFGSFGMLEIGLILIVGVVVFGAMKLPRLAKNLSAGWGELKRLKKGFDLGLDEDDPPPRQHTQSYGHGQEQYGQPSYYGNPGQQPPYQGEGNGARPDSDETPESNDKKSG
jgi:Sec-independent protein translocase protein TatA